MTNVGKQHIYINQIQKNKAKYCKQLRFTNTLEISQLNNLNLCNYSNAMLRKLFWKQLYFNTIILIDQLQELRAQEPPHLHRERPPRGPARRDARGRINVKEKIVNKIEKTVFLINS